MNDNLDFRLKEISDLESKLWAKKALLHLEWMKYILNDLYVMTIEEKKVMDNRKATYDEKKNVFNGILKKRKLKIQV
jgi:hypothetical protein